MAFKGFLPILWADKPEETICILHNHPWFTCAEYNDDSACLQPPFEKQLFNGSLYINVDNVEELWEDYEISATFYLILKILPGKQSTYYLCY